MGVIGITLIVGAVLYVIVRPQTFLHCFHAIWRAALAHVPPRPPENSLIAEDNGRQDDSSDGKPTIARPPSPSPRQDAVSLTLVRPPTGGGRPEKPQGMEQPSLPPPPPPPLTIAVTGGDDEEKQTTPRAGPISRSDLVPPFSLPSSDDSLPWPARPAPLSAPSAAATARLQPASDSLPLPSRLGLMGPPPRPGIGAIAPPRQPGAMGPPPPPVPVAGLMTPSRRPQPPTLSGPASSLSTSSPLSRSTLPVPNRGPASSSSLAPPPTNSTKTPVNRSASRLATLEPGHSPMDWARISGPNADLRGLPSSTPYLRVTPSMLKKQNGRKGTDAWSAFGGRVYNITPYIPFHPGGKGELFRGAGKDATKLFAEIHPWVNYESMLAACLVGILVEEEDANAKNPNGTRDEMEEMD